MRLYDIYYIIYIKWENTKLPKRPLVKILLYDLVLQKNDKNFDIIKEIIYNGFISDENDIYNDVYSHIIFSDKLPKNYLEFKVFLE